MPKVSTITSGQITLDDIRSEFEITGPIDLSMLYAGGQYIQAGYYRSAAAAQALADGMAVNQPIPTSGPISLANFYGVKKLPFIVFEVQKSNVEPNGVDIPILSKTERLSTTTIKDIQVYFRTSDNKIVLKDVSTGMEYPLQKAIDVSGNRVSVLFTNLSGTGNGTMGTNIPVTSTFNQTITTSAGIGTISNRQVVITIKDNIITQNTSSFTVTLKAENTFVPLVWATIPSLASSATGLINGTITARSQIEYTTGVSKARLKIDSTWYELTQQTTVTDRVEFKARVISGQLTNGESTNTWKPVGLLSEWVVSTGIDSVKDVQVELMVRDNEQLTNTAIYNLQITATNLFKNIVWDSNTTNIAVTHVDSTLLPLERGATITINSSNGVYITDGTNNVRTITTNSYGRLQYKIRVVSGVNELGNYVDNTWKTATTNGVYNFGVSVPKSTTESVVYELQFRDSQNSQNVLTRTLNLSVTNTFTSIVYNNALWTTASISGSNAVKVDATWTLKSNADNSVTLEGSGQSPQTLCANGYGRIQAQLVKTAGSDWVGVPTGWVNLTTISAYIRQLKDTAQALTGTYTLTLRDTQETTNTKAYSFTISSTNTFKTMVILNPFSQTSNVKNISSTGFINGTVTTSFDIVHSGNVLTITDSNQNTYTVCSNTYGRVQYMVTPNANISQGQTISTWQDVPATGRWSVSVTNNQSKTGQVVIQFRDREEVTTIGAQNTINVTATNTFIDIVWTSYTGTTLTQTQFVNGTVSQSYTLGLNAQNVLIDSVQNTVTQNTYGRLQFKTTVTSGNFTQGSLVGVSSWTDWNTVSNKDLVISTGVNSSKSATIKIEFRDKLNTSNTNFITMTLGVQNTFVPFAFNLGSYTGESLQNVQFVNGNVTQSYNLILSGSGAVTSNATSLITQTYGRLQIKTTVTNGAFTAGQLLTYNDWTDWTTASTLTLQQTTGIDQTKSGTMVIYLRDKSDPTNQVSFTIVLTATNTFKRIVWANHPGTTVSVSQLVNGDVSGSYSLNHASTNVASDTQTTVTSNTYGRLQVRYTQVQGTPTSGNLSSLTAWSSINGNTAYTQVVTTGINQTKQSVFDISFRDQMDTTNTYTIRVTINVTNTFEKIVWGSYTGGTVQTVALAPNQTVSSLYTLTKSGTNIQDTKGTITQNDFGRLQIRYISVQGTPSGGNISAYTAWTQLTANTQLTYRNDAGNNSTKTSQFTVEFRDSLDTGNVKQISIIVTAQNTFVPITFTGANTTFQNLTQFVVDASVVNNITIQRQSNVVTVTSTSGGQLTLCQNDLGRQIISTSAKQSTVAGTVVTSDTLQSSLTYAIGAPNNSTVTGSITITITDQLDSGNTRQVIITWGAVNTYIPIVWNVGNGTTQNFGTNTVFAVDATVNHGITINRTGNIVRVASNVFSGNYSDITSNDVGSRVRMNISFGQAPSSGSTGSALNPSGQGFNNAAGNSTTKSQNITVTFYDSVKQQNQITVYLVHAATNQYVPIGFYTGSFNLGGATTSTSGGMWHQISIRTVGNRIYVRDDYDGEEVTLCDNDLGRARVTISMASGTLNGGSVFSDGRPSNHPVQIYTTDNQSKAVTMNITIYDSAKTANQVTRQVTWQVSSQYIPQNPFGTPNQIRNSVVVIQTGGASAGIEYFMSGSALYQRIIKGAAETDYQIGTNTTGAGWDIQFTVVSQIGSGAKYIKPSTARHQIGSSSRIYVTVSVQSGTATSEQVINVKIWDRQSGALMYDGNQRIYAEADGAIH